MNDELYTVRLLIATIHADLEELIEAPVCTAKATSARGSYTRMPNAWMSCSYARLSARPNWITTSKSATV